MKSFQFELQGKMPLLMHADDVESADELEAWRKAPENKNRSKAGDDRSPAWTWQTYLYSDGEHVAMPAANIMVALRTSGTQLILKRQKTFKELSQSGLLIETEMCDFLVGGRQISMAEIIAIRDQEFRDQATAAREMGFSLFVRRAAIGRSKHVRVRPRFDNWSVRGVIHVLSPDISDEILEKLFELAGRAGLCDWRPSGKTPGPFGMFTSEISRV